MRKFRFGMRMRSFLPLVFLTSLVYLFSTCSKNNDVDREKQKLQTVTERFLNVPDGTDPIVKRVAEEIKKRNNKNEFINSFSHKNGFPIWDKSLVHISSHGKQGTSSNMDNENPADSIVYIPLVLTEQGKVNGYIAANVSTEGIALLYTLSKDYKAFSFEKDSINLNQASKVALNMMLLNTKVFGATKYTTTDYRLLVYDTIYDKNKDAVISFRLAGTCWEVSWQTIHCGTPGLACCSGASGCDLPTGTCPGQCYYENHSIEICSGGTDVDWPAGGIGVSTGGGGPSGSGGGGSMPHYYPCISSPAPLLPPDTPPCPEPEPGPGWTPSTIQDVQNLITNPCILEVYNLINSDRLKSKMAQMLNTFAHDKFINVTFDESSTMPGDTYGMCQKILADNYKLTFNTNILPGASQEFIANTIFHEVIHAYIKYHYNDYDFVNNSSHIIMLNTFLGQLSDAIQEIFPNLSQVDSYCISFEGIIGSDHDDAITQAIKSQVEQVWVTKILTKFPNSGLTDENSILARAHTYNEDGTAGTRNPNCP